MLKQKPSVMQRRAGRSGTSSPGGATYSDDELRLLLRFAARSYETMRAATAELKASQPPKSKKARAK